VIEERPLGDLTPEQVRAAILGFAGEYEQTVPRFSAVKVAGVPAYKLARKGEAVPERKRRVRLWDLMVESVSLPEAIFQVTCSSGTYVRSLVEDIGQRLGVGAHLTVLRRLRAGSLFTAENSFTLERIEERTAKGDSGLLRNPVEFLTDHVSLTLAADAEQPLRDGRDIPIGESPLGESAPGPHDARLEVRSGAKMKVLRPDGMLIAVGEIVAHGPHALSFHPTKVLI
jgi:tRNA pseudouridine55 synthase